VAEASFVACVVQTLLALYLGVKLRRGATTGSRRTLSRIVLEIAGYSGSLAIYFFAQAPLVAYLLPPLALVFSCFAQQDLLAFALFYLRGAHASDTPRLPSYAGVALRALAALSLVACIVLLRLDRPSLWPEHALTVQVLATNVAAVVVLALATRRGVKGARGYLVAALLPLAPIVGSILGDAGVLPQQVFRLVRDLCILGYEVSLLTSYLDDGTEPMSLRDRIVAGVLMAVLSVVTAVAHLLLPNDRAVVAGVPFLLAHAAAIRLVGIAGSAALAVALFVPRLYRSSVLRPIERLTAGLARAERGERVELPIEREDELGGVSRSFNTMVSALASGRETLAEKVTELQRQKDEIAGLNEELRRQIAARSRQLADALRRAGGPGEAIGPGLVLDDRYLVEEPLGEGGMGKVFGAKRLHDGRSLALKVISSASADDAVRFMREAELAATLAHENLVSVIDVGMHNGTPYFLMERLHGGSLADASDRFGEPGFVLPILGQVARGLRELHARGVLHRDLKPANVLLTGDAARPVAKIGDFGIASASIVSELGATMPADAAALSKTAPGSVMGTLPYMAPELAAGPKEYGPPSDVFAFGVLAWEVLAGSLPFRVPAVLTAMSGGVIGTPSTEALRVPGDVADLLHRCLSTAPDARPPLTEILRVLDASVPAPP